jgi:glycosyltransferase involved in cell wall biosynthesis
MSNPIASVIIPTYKDTDRLRLCIEHLLAQTLPREMFEIIVVNNDRDDHEDCKTWFNNDRITVISESRPGSYNARNRGAHRARADILVFTDSDCLPKSDWLQKLTSHMQDTNADLVTGAIQMIASNPHRLTALEAYDMATGLPQASLARDQIGVTANLASRKDKFLEIGGFEGDRFSGGDIDFCQRIAASGGRFEYCEHATVYHPVRSEWHEILHKARRIAGSKAAANPREIIRITPRLIKSQFRGLLLIWRFKEFTIAQRLKATSVLALVKTFQAWEFLSVFLARKRHLR